VPGVSTAYGLYSVSGPNYFGGNVGIGTATPAVMLEVTGTAKFDSPVTFAGGNQTFPIANGGVWDAMLANPYSGTGNCPAGTFVAGLVRNNGPNCVGGVALLAAASNAFTGNVLAGGTSFKGSNVLEVQTTSGADALTVNSTSGAIALGPASGTGSGPQVTTASQNSDFSGYVTINAGLTYSNTITFTPHFLQVPSCTATPYIVTGGNAPASGTPSWYIVYSTSGSQYSALTVYLAGSNPNTYALNFSYICVGNPN